MDLVKLYYSSDGKAINILQLVKCEPEWAANRIQVGERALAMLTDSQRRIAEMGNAPAQHAATPCPHCAGEGIYIAPGTRGRVDPCAHCGCTGISAGPQ